MTPDVKGFLKAAFVSDGTSDGRDWPDDIAKARQIGPVTPKVSAAFVSYFRAATKEQRCFALQKWYDQGIAMGG